MSRIASISLSSLLRPVKGRAARPMMQKTEASDGRTILAVDEQRLVCEGIQGLLEAADFEVLTAESGRTAGALSRRRAPSTSSCRPKLVRWRSRAG